MTIVRPTGGPAAQGDDRFPPRTGLQTGLGQDSTVPVAIRAERVDAQVALFVRAGYRVERRTPLQAVMIREHRRTVGTRLADAVRTLGVVPVLTGAPRAYHRVVVTVAEDGAISLI